VKYLFLQFLFLALVATNGAQERLQVLVQKAPDTYPPAAHAVRARGEVIIAVEVDADGKVVNARSVSGHPLLRTTSEATAREWVFSKLDPSVGRTRKFNLFFDFVDGERESIAESEESESIVLRKIFPTAFSVTLSRITVQPRLLMLPRERGIIPTAFCSLHKHEMAVEVRSLICKPEDDPQYLALIKIPANYIQAQTELFPNANVVGYDHNCGLREREEVYYCSVCRIKRTEWIQDNE
jgi:hypothetical protein